MKRLQLLASIILFQLNLFAQFTPDTTKDINTWKLNNTSWGVVEVDIDTSLSQLQQVNPFLEHYFSYSNTGNLGGVLINNVFRDRFDVNDFHLIEPYYYQFNTGSNYIFYNTKSPYTNFRYSFNPGAKSKDEQMVDVLHTQNIKPWFNVGIKFRFIGSKGQYAANSTSSEWPQRTRNGMASLFSSYNGVNYNFHGSISFNNLKVNQHGGIRIDSTTELSQETEEFLVNLYGANVHYKNLNVFLLNTYDFKRKPKDSIIHKPLIKFTGIHSLNVNLNRRIFIDDITEEKSRNENFNYYDNYLYDTTFTKDSTGYRSFENEIGVRMRIGRSDSSVFYAYFNYLFELQDYGLATDDSTSANWAKLRNDKFYNQGVKYGIEGDLWGFYATFSGRNYFAGYKLGDTYWKGKFGKRVKISNTIFDLGLKGSLKLREPGYLYKNFSSNNFNFSGTTSFDKESILDYGAELINRDLNLKLGAYQTIVSNYVYFDSLAMPKQYSDPIIIQTIYWQQLLKLWKFHFNNQLALQISTENELLAIPKLNYLGELYFDHTIHFKFTGGKIWFNLGVETFITDEYYAYKFYPAGEQFYVQNDAKQLYGLYPYVNPFVRAKIKRLRVFFMYEHVNSDMIEPEYFTLIDYPSNKRIMKLGISWLFYD